MAPREDSAVPEAGLSSIVQLSQSEIFEDVRLMRRLFRIPSDQGALLEKSDSWAQSLDRRPKPGLNLPPVILENLRSHHKTKADAKKTRSPQIEESEDQGGGREQDGSEEQDESGEEEVTDEQEETEEQEEEEGQGQGNGNLKSTHRQPPLNNRFVQDQDEEEAADINSGTPVTWSPSPMSQRTARIQREFPPEQSPEPELMQPPENGQRPENGQAFLSQVPPSSPVQPTLKSPVLERVSDSTKRPVFSEPPSSSQDVEEELEVMAPAPFTKLVPPVNKTAELMPTPPSAQVQVSSTFGPNSSTGQQQLLQPKKKDRLYRRTAGDILDGLPNRKAKVAAPVATGRMAPPKRASSIDISDTQSTVYSSSAVIPSTYVDLQGGSPEHCSKAAFPKSTIKETPRISRNSNTSYGLPGRQSLIHLPVSSGSKPPSPSRPRPPSSGPPSHQHSAPEPESPFMLFSLAYPYFTGSFGDFVKACMVIQSLQHKRPLATYQYDDFIRAWSEGYLPYIRSLNRSDSPRGAIDWYLLTVEDLIFSKNIVTRHNLDSILELYADEVQRARSSMIGAGDKALTPLIPKSNSPRALSTHLLDPSEETSPMQQQPLELLTDAEESSAQHTMRPPEAPEPPVMKDHAVTRIPSTSIASKPLSSKRPLSDDLEGEAHVSKKMARDSRAPSGSGDTKSHRPELLKNTTTNDNRSDRVSEDVSVDFRIPSDTGSATSRQSGPSRNMIQPTPSGPPSSSGYYRGMKKPDEDPEKRSRRWTKFLEKRKKKARESIAGSAVNGTPTPGQKG